MSKSSFQVKRKASRLWVRRSVALCWYLTAVSDTADSE
jgi:hypothetical protein